jgi:hypothetical protein
VRNQKHVTAAIAAMPETAWLPLADYPPSGEAEIAETTLGTRRLIVRRTRLVGDQAELWPDWRHFGFVTNRTDPLELVEAGHRHRAVVELLIRDLKDQALAHFPPGQFPANAAWALIGALAHFPPGQFPANAAWALIGALAHNLLCWIAVIGTQTAPIEHVRTLRLRLLAVPGRLVRSARRWRLRLPARWPWQTQFTTALERIAAIPLTT